NTPQLIAALFDATRIINLINDGKETISANDLDLLKTTFRTFTKDILGLYDETASSGNESLISGLMVSIRPDIRDS
ncbi:MAG TPA: cysteine--tRNA ligase, partial [Bacteroidales bacterium]|nr:cysteine--tRNA ligase [Bacteroidales bacterium]